MTILSNILSNRTVAIDSLPTSATGPRVVHQINPVIVSPDDEQAVCEKRIKALNDARDKAAADAREAADRIRKYDHLLRGEQAKLNVLVGPSVEAAEAEIVAALDDFTRTAALEDYDIEAEVQTARGQPAGEVEEAA